MTDLRVLKQNAGIEAFRRRLSSLKRSGAGYVALCPFHADGNPSLSIFQRDGEWFYKCHACEKGGDLICFVESTDGLPFLDAVETIAKESNFDLPARNQTAPSTCFEYRQESAVEALKLNDAAGEYLKSRGIDRPFAVFHGVGVVDHPSIGMALSIPYSASVVKFRALNPTAKGDKFRHLTGSESSDLLYGIEQLNADNAVLVATPEVFVVESELDCLTMRSHGFSAVSVSSATTCLKDGKLRIKPEHIEKLSQAERIFVATDMDDAGDKCAAAFEAVLPPHKAFRVRWAYKKGGADAKDIGEVYVQTLDKFRERVQQLRQDALNRPPAWRGLFKVRSEMDPGEIKFLIKDFLPEGVCLIGGLSSAGKTWVALSMAQALTTGRKFLGRFDIPEPLNVIYLVPEAGERSFRARMDKMRIDKRFFCRTMKDGLPPNLDAPLLLAAVRDLKPVVFLDTMVRFAQVESENSASENANGLASGVFNLLNSGAQALVGLHHSPKSSAKQDMTLENVLRGTGDLGAMCDAVYGLRVVDRERLEIKVECVKPRDFEPVPPFSIQGRPYINEIGDFGVLIEPTLPGEQDEVVRLSTAIQGDPQASYRELQEVTGIATGRIEKVASKAGWTKRGRNGWVSNVIEFRGKTLIN
jgi:5S rRNA maturation endonuclease (ribonuclease M5)